MRDRKRLLFEPRRPLTSSTSSKSNRLKSSQRQIRKSSWIEFTIWWSAEGAAERDAYAIGVYPTFFSPSQLRKRVIVRHVFTHVLSGLFPVIWPGARRTASCVHRDRWREGWWQELATSRPPSDVQSWLDRLKAGVHQNNSIKGSFLGDVLSSICTPSPVGWTSTSRWSASSHGSSRIVDRSH